MIALVKVGEIFRTSIQFHDDTGNAVDPTSLTASMQKPDGTWVAQTAPSKQNGKTGLYGISISTLGFDPGIYNFHITGIVPTGKTVGTVFTFQVRTYNEADINNSVSSVYSSVGTLRASIGYIEDMVYDQGTQVNMTFGAANASLETIDEVRINMESVISNLSELNNRLTVERASNLDNLDSPVSQTLAAVDYVPGEANIDYNAVGNAVWEHDNRTLTPIGGGVGVGQFELQVAVALDGEHSIGHAVWVYTDDRIAFRQALTNAQGIANIHLDAGDYYVLATKDGAWPKETFITVASNATLDIATSEAEVTEMQTFRLSATKLNDWDVGDEEYFPVSVVCDQWTKFVISEAQFKVVGPDGTSKTIAGAISGDIVYFRFAPWSTGNYQITVIVTVGGQLITHRWTVRVR